MVSVATHSSWFWSVGRGGKRRQTYKGVFNLRQMFNKYLGEWVRDSWNPIRNFILFTLKYLFKYKIENCLTYKLFAQEGVNCTDSRARPWHYLPLAGNTLHPGGPVATASLFPNVWCYWNTPPTYFTRGTRDEWVFVSTPRPRSCGYASPNCSISLCPRLRANGNNFSLLHLPQSLPLPSDSDPEGELGSVLLLLFRVLWGLGHPLPFWAWVFSGVK